MATRLALKWIESKKDHVAGAGWATLAGLTQIKDDSELDLAELKQLLARIEKTIHDAPDRVKYQMNRFVIAVGSNVKSLTDLAMATGKKIGKITVDMGDTDCKVPYSPDYIDKVEAARHDRQEAEDVPVLNEKDCIHQTA